MKHYEYYAGLLDEEAKKKLILADLAAEDVIRDGHMESALALWIAAELLRKEAKRKCRHCRKSGTKSRFSRKRLITVSPLIATGRSQER